MLDIQPLNKQTYLQKIAILCMILIKNRLEEKAIKRVKRK